MQRKFREVFLEIASELQSLEVEERIIVLIELSEGMGFIGDDSGLKQIEKEIAALPQEEDRFEALGSIAVPLAQVGDRAAVARICHELHELQDHWKINELVETGVHALQLLAVEMVANDIVEASSLADKAVELVHTAKPSLGMVESLVNMGTALWQVQETQAAQRVLAGADKLARAQDEHALAVVARLHAFTGNKQIGSQLLAEGAMLARSHNSRELMFNYLESSIPALLALDSSGEMLVEVWERVHNVEGWWRHTNDEHPNV